MSDLKNSVKTATTQDIVVDAPNGVAGNAPVSSIVNKSTSLSLQADYGADSHMERVNKSLSEVFNKKNQEVVAFDKGIVSIRPVKASQDYIVAEDGTSKSGHKLLPQGVLTITAPADKHRNRINYIDKQEFIDALNPVGNEVEVNKAYLSFIEDNCIRLTTKGLHLDLNNPIDCISLKLLKHSKLVAKSLAEVNSSIHFFYIENVIEEAKAKVARQELVLEAQNLINVLSLTEKRHFLLLFGYNTEKMPDLVVAGKLTEEVLKDPQSCISKLKDASRRIKQVFKLALYSGTIVLNNNAYYYKDATLGYTEDEAVRFLLTPSNINLLMSIANA